MEPHVDPDLAALGEEQAFAACPAAGERGLAGGMERREERELDGVLHGVEYGGAIVPSQLSRGRDRGRNPYLFALQVC
jgi:hypothetical protein